MKKSNLFIIGLLLFMISTLLVSNLDSSPVKTWKAFREPKTDRKDEIFKNVDTNLVNIFLTMEKEWGEELPIAWAYRDPKLNKKVGGAKNSAHMYGKAIDIRFEKPDKEKIKKLITIASKYNVLGIGVYSDQKSLHIDIDENKGRRAWGSNYSRSSIPVWAKNEVQKHLLGN